jgi:protoheme IX farnesyltransferase
MVLLTVAIGFVMAHGGASPASVLASVLVGSGLSCAGASALNQYFERDADGTMDRTRFRPLPSRRVSPSTVLGMGIVCAAGGVAYLAATVNSVTAALDALTIVSYVFVYTPMKRLSSLSTLAGAVPGALPPVMGWTAATGHLDDKALILFSILFLWQIPHFLAIGQLYKRDYARGGFPMLVVIDEKGAVTGRQIIVYATALIPVALMPTIVGLTGPWYFWLALALSLAYLGFGIQAARRANPTAFRHLLLCSVAYLPLLMAAMVLDRIVP